MSSLLESSPEKVPGAAAFWGCGAVKVAVLFWMGCHALPISSWDEVVFMQPAYMHLHTGLYSVPTYVGTLPHASEIAAYYSPLHELIYGVLFEVLGFSRWTSLGIHMTVHLLLSGLVAGVIWRITRNGWLAGLYWLAATYLLGQVGRPEELGLLFGTLAIVIVSSRTRRWLAASALLGAAGATAPVGAVIATAIAVCRLGLELGFRRPFVKLCAGMVVAAICVTAAITCWYIHPFYRDAWQQFQALQAYAYRAPLDLLLIDFNPFGLSSLIIFGLVACGLTLRLFVARRKNRAPSPAWLDAVGPMLLVSVGGICLARWMGRPSYDYRWLGYLWSSIAVVVACEMGRTVWHGQRWKFIVVNGCLFVGFTLANRDTVRYCIAPMLLRRDSVTYSEAVAEVNRIVPKSASVGGDFDLWMAITDGRPFIAVKWIGLEYWPDYLISCSLGWNQFPVLEKPSWERKIQAEYQEIPLSWLAAPANRLAIGNWTIPVLHGDADWRFRIWKRRTLRGTGPMNDRAAAK